MYSRRSNLVGEIENYEKFLQVRREKFATELNDFLTNITESTSLGVPITLEELIAGGEGEELELKSSLRWDYVRGELNKNLENVMLKTVAALANGQGGTLLIGVRDDGKVLGLEHDYHSPWAMLTGINSSWHIRKSTR